MEEKSKKRILLVEDDASLSEMYEQKLQIEGFEVIVARDGAEGLEAALKNHPDLILLDILMPKMDGMSVMKRLREDSWGKDVPIIILTNLNADDKILQGIMENHPAYYLMKSNSEPAAVLERVKEVLG